YTDSLLSKIGVETQFKEGTFQTNLEFRFAPIKPYVEFVKRLDTNKVSSTKFEFQLNVSTYIKKLRILAQRDGIYRDGKSINIEKFGVELELYLEQIVTAVYYLSNPIKLGSKKFELKNLSL